MRAGLCNNFRKDARAQHQDDGESLPIVTQFQQPETLDINERVPKRIVVGGRGLD